MVFLPYHIEEVKEMRENSDVGYGYTRQHAPMRRLPTHADTSHASSSPEWWWCQHDDPSHVTGLNDDDVNMM